MNRTVLTLIPAMIVCVGCTKSFKEEPELQQLTFNAVFEEQKTTLADNGSTILWDAGEEINIFQGATSSAKFTSTNTEQASQVSFTGYLSVATGTIESDSTGVKFWAVYPYNEDNSCDGLSVTFSVPAEQNAVANSLPQKAFPCISRSNNLMLPFYNVCGGVKFTVGQTGIKSIVFKGKADETLAGKVRVTMVKNRPEVDSVVEGEKEVRLTAPTSEGFAAGTAYYISLLPAQLTSGFTIELYKDDSYAEFSTSSSVRIKRSVFGSMLNIDKDLVWTPVSEDSSCVDLGLSVKWATCNIGASSPEQYGRYFAWGDVTGQTWNGSKWSGSGFSTYPTYEVDSNNNLKPAYDAAHVNLGGNWRMPTEAECQELIDNCTCTWTDNYNSTGVAGRIFTSKKTGYTDKSIFLPAAGYGGDGLICKAYTDGFFWSSTLNNSSIAWVLNFYLDSVSMINSYHLHGFPIRPIQEFPSIDLSKNGTANCYIVSSAGYYKFNATEKGNSTESVGTPVSAEVLWESFGTDVTPNVGDIVKNVSLDEGYVKFSTPSTLNNGNAVIAVKDASSNILWSWHIWVCKDFDAAASAQDYNNSAGTMMDRNLGATSATPGDVHALGLLYQWGRKDPFLSGNSISSETDAASTLSWPSAVASDASNGTIAYAVKHPTTYITRNSSNYDWYYTESSSTDNTRWQISDNSKGVYDPCPAGWRVPDGGASYVWSTAFGSSSDYENGPWNSTNYGMDFGSGNSKSSIMQLGASSAIWYPAAGYRSSNSGSLFGVGNRGNCWSCTHNIITAYSLYFGINDNVSPSYSGSRANGHSVRCIKEGSQPSKQAIDLSKSGTANCYIVSKSGDYKFNATVKGGSSESVGTPVTAEVLWESFGTDVTPSVGELVNNISLSDGHLMFSATEKKGNAVIAVKDESGNILWSWHIWLTDQPVEQVCNNSAGTMMDHNLGATSATPGDVHALGLLYQWGRKDPFLSGNSISSSTIASSTLSWPSAVSSDANIGTISYAVAHPTTFITYNTSNCDWYYTGTSSTDNSRWRASDEVKGIFDPCPAGWRVPDGDIWNNAGLWSYYSGNPWDSTNLGMNFGSGNGFSLNHQLGIDTSIWYPASGRCDSSTGVFYDNGSFGAWWSCSISGYYASLLFITQSTVDRYSYHRSHGSSVRCVMEY